MPNLLVAPPSLAACPLIGMLPNVQTCRHGGRRYKQNTLPSRWFCKAFLD